MKLLGFQIQKQIWKPTEGRVRILCQPLPGETEHGMETGNDLWSGPAGAAVSGCSSRRQTIAENL